MHAPFLEHLTAGQTTPPVQRRSPEQDEQQAEASREHEHSPGHFAVQQEAGSRAQSAAVSGVQAGDVCGCASMQKDTHQSTANDLCSKSSSIPAINPPHHRQRELREDDLEAQVAHDVEAGADGADLKRADLGGQDLHGGERGAAAWPSRNQVRQRGLHTCHWRASCHATPSHKRPAWRSSPTTACRWRFRRTPQTGTAPRSAPRHRCLRAKAQAEGSERFAADHGRRIAPGTSTAKQHEAAPQACGRAAACEHLHNPRQHGHVLSRTLTINASVVKQDASDQGSRDLTQQLAHSAKHLEAWSDSTAGVVLSR